MKNIILASGSPRRKELLAQIGLEFQVITSDADESVTITDPAEIVMELATRKAKAVLDTQNINSDHLIIGADTIVYSDGKILGKPKNEEEALNMIRSLSGNVHQVYTGVAVITDETTIRFYEKTNVCVYEMSEQEIKKYIATGDPFDKAGGYGIQGAFAAFVKGIHGDYNNVVGLPVARLYQELRKAELI